MLSLFYHSVSFCCSLLLPYIPLQNVCASRRFRIQRLWVLSSLFNCWNICPWFLTNIQFCWYWLIRELNLSIFALIALICCFISSLTMLTLFLRMFYLLSIPSIFMFLLNISFLFFSQVICSKSPNLPWIPTTSSPMVSSTKTPFFSLEVC